MHDFQERELFNYVISIKIKCQPTDTYSEMTDRPTPLGGEQKKEADGGKLSSLLNCYLGKAENSGFSIQVFVK